MKIRMIITGLFLFSNAAAYGVPPWLHIDGNKIKNPNGNVIVLRGVSMVDLGATQSWYGGATNMINRVTDMNDDTGVSPGWYTKIIRIPICPHDSALFAWSPITFDPNDPNAPGNDTLYNLLRTVVDYCADKDVYAIIDWHEMANTYDKVAYTNVFWEYMAQRFADDSHVLFELFNEPINSTGTEAQQWESVRANMQTWVDIVRTYAPHNLIFVGTPSYDQVLGPVVDNPINDVNVAYICHLYPGEWLERWAPQSWYTNHVITCAAEYPVICTEWGFTTNPVNYTGVLFDGTISNYGRPFKEFLEQYGIGNTAWCASYDWNPPIFRPMNWHLRCGEGEMGCFTKDWLYEKNGPMQSIDLTTTKCKVKAGKTQFATQGPDANDVNKMRDYFYASGTFTPSPLRLTSLTQMDVNIVSLNDGNVIYAETIDFSISDIANNRFNHSYRIPRGQPGAITSLKIDFANKTFAITAKNIDLTGLGAPLRLDIGIGNSILSGEVNETIINGSRRSIPTRLMRLYDDTLIVTKAKARASTRPSSDSLSVKGEIAVADMVLDDNEPNLVIEDVNITWGDIDDTNVQTFTIPVNNFKASRRGHTYKCSKVDVNPSDDPNLNDGLVTAKIDLDKCTFAVSIKGANDLYVGPGSGYAKFGISFDTPSGTFDETDDVNLILGH